ncbi:A-kinase anchor protein 9 isoform X2 [Dromiciops gliroides]|uniref:A-kinase anchor protein 9 isoform X2 n=1 Tax=Dromiciops gliroides TaxID=33562 RepID=UPI001CC3EE25|nr:A-kinase anchor protein 9 isoform X2 [Dromiciops gliroides]
MEDEERQKKLEAGRAKLAQFQQKKAQSDGQNPSKKQKRKKKSSVRKYEDSSYTSNIDQSQGEELYMTSSQRGASVTPEFSIMRTVHTGEIIKHDQSYTLEPESEISTTADDYSSEVNGCSLMRADIPTNLLMEEEFGVGESYSEQGAQYPSTRLEMMENELAGKQQEIEELNRELEEMRAAYGTEGLQQLQEFEAAIKQRDGIITQLTANLQQARREKDETMREFLELTEQSQKLQIQFQHLQASETLRNSSHSSTAADLLQAKQQILTHQQQLEEQDHLLEDYQKKKEEFKMQINFLQEKIRTYEMKEQNKVEDSSKKELQEKESIIEELKTKIIEEERNSLELKDKLSATDKLVGELKEQIIEKNQEINNIRLELTNSKQKERQCSDEIKQLMGTVEELQKKNHKDSQFETDMVQRMEQETQRKLEQLRAELDEMYGQQIVQMKQELIKQHVLQIDELNARHKGELENTLKSCPNIPVNENQIQLMNMAITELNLKLQDTNSQREKIKEELEVISGEKSTLQRQLEDLFEELSFSRDQIQRARQTIVEQEGKLNEAHKLLSSVEDLKAQIVSASEFRKELELKHEAEVTNYKIKLEMLEKEKNAVLDRMAESQEAELERLRTQLLFSHEEELSKLREDLEIEHQINIEKLKDNLGIHYKQQIEELHNEMSQKIETMQFEKDNLITKQNQLLLEISKLKDLQQSLVNSKSEEMTLQISELQKEIEVLRQEEKEKGTLEQEVQELQLKTEFLEKQIKEKEDDLQEKFTQLETENTILKNEKKALEDMLKIYSPVSKEENLIFIDAVKPKSEDFDWQKKFDILLEENEKLTKQCTQLNEEIEKQRNTYSFAEKNFEVNYQELREEYACLLKVKADLEESKSKQEVEYQMKLKALTDELYHLQRSKPVLVKAKSADSESCKDDKSFIAEISEVGEVVEKDTTELMEKLEVTQREKLELSERLSDLSEQLKQKHGEINHLSEEVKSLKQEKEQVLKRCKELEIIVGHSRAEHVDELKLKLFDLRDDIQTEGSKDSKNPTFKINKDFSEGTKIIEENKISFEDVPVKKESKQELVKPGRYSLWDHVDSVTDQLANESSSSSLIIAQSENDQLRQELSILKSEQEDLRLQMEAQRLCLSLVHSAHVKQVQVCMEEERASALSSLREGLVSVHEEEMKELQKIHNLELQNVKRQEADDEGMSLEVLMEKLHKAVMEECSCFNRSLCNSFGTRNTAPFKYEVKVEERGIPDVYFSDVQEDSPELQNCTFEVQDLQSNLQSLINKIAEEYNKLLTLQSQLTKDCEKIQEQQAENAKLEFAKEEEMTNLKTTEAKCLSKISSQTKNIDVTDSLPPLEGTENMKNQRGAQDVQEQGPLAGHFQPQLKEAGVKDPPESLHLEGEHQLPRESVLQPSLFTESLTNIDQVVLKTRYIESGLQKTEDGSTKFANKTGTEEEMDIVQLLEKQHQERLEEEVAKVIVSMSVAFAQQSEIARLSRQKEDITAGTHAYRQKEPFAADVKSSQNEFGVQAFEAEEMKFKELKPLSKELREEESKAMLLSNSNNLESPFELKDQELDFSREIFSPHREFIFTDHLQDEILASNTDTSRQLMVHEEQLEDLRQELVRQYQEHQQATELLKQAHMRQMERQREDQEQLQEEIKRLHRELAQSASIDNENLVTERERVLLEELEALKQRSLAGREKLCCELRSSCTQTQDESENQEVEEQIFQEELEAKPQTVSSDILSKERYALQKANNRLLKILLEVVKTIAAVEETIGRHVLGILDRSNKVQSSANIVWKSESEGTVKSCIREEDIEEEPIGSYCGSGMPSNATSTWSEITDERMELCQRLLRCGFAGTEIDPENEELVLNVSSRLQAAVEKLLEAISETSNQLEHAKVTQTELLRESFRQKQEATEFLKCQEELQERLNEELKAREQLAVELSKAEGIIDGYADEKAVFERQIQEKTDMIDHLEQELLCVGNRLQELEAERQQIQEERELLSRQKDAMKAEAGPVEQRLVDAAVDAAPGAELLQETEKLMKEKLEVQCQAEKVCDDLQKQVKALEMDVEEQVSRFMELEQEKNAELTDLRQQNQALEKQLEKMRKFLDEQAIDREHERDVFQQEIQKLEQQLKATPKFQPISEHQTREVEQLTNHLKEKTDKCSELLLSKEQLQRDVQERNEEIEKLESRIRELEQALLISADNLQKVENRKHFGAMEAKELPLEVQLQAEREALDRKEKEITNLEEQLEQFREELENKNEEVQQLHMQLEIQKKESTTRLEELEQENRLFKDEMERLGFAVQEFEDVSTKDHHQLFGKFTQMIQEKELEIGRLSDHITKLQQQLEITTDNKVIEEKNQLIRYLESQLECLKSDQERIKKNSEEEIEQLNDVIEKLQQELSSIEQKAPVDFPSLLDESDSLRQQLDTLRTDKWALEQQVERTHEEAGLTQTALEEAYFQMNRLKEELNTLKDGKRDWAQTRSARDFREDDNKNQPEDLQGALEPQESQAYLQPPKYKGKDSVGDLELVLQQLQEKEAELTRCQQHMEDVKEQSRAEREALHWEVNSLQEMLEEKVAALVVSQAQLRAVQEYAGSWQQTRAASAEHPEEAASKPSGLTVGMSQWEGHVAETDASLLPEKEQADTAKNNRWEKDFEKTLEEMEKQQEGEDTGTAEVRETSGALQEELRQIKHQLMEAEKKLEYYSKKEGELTVLESEKSSCDIGQLLAEQDSHLIGKNSSSQTDKLLQVSSGNQTSQVPVKNTGIQSDLQSTCSSEDVTEIIRQFTEKIDQMQELHAAEILDMEARHITEAENLKREQFVAVQLLTEECNTLKAVIQCLRAREGISVPGSTHSDSYQSREMCSSDSGSDWSQGVYLTQSQGFDTASDGPGEEGESSTDSFPKKIKGLLRAVHNEGIQVLSLTEPPYSEGDASFAQQASEFWLEERKTYLNTISSLKDLITKMQVQREMELYESSQSHENPPDWRGEFLHALQQVFLKERNILLAMFKTDLTALGFRDVPGLLNQLEQRLQEQGTEYRAAMEYIQGADRRSLLTEIQTLQAQINSKKITMKREQEGDSQNQELLEPNMQQKQAQILEMQVELSSLKERAAELQEQLNSERVRAAELQDERTQAKLELETTLKAQHKHLKELEAFRMEVKEKTDKVHLLNDTLANEQKKTRELQWALEKEKAKLERSEEREREELEDLKYSLEGQKQRNIQLNQLLEQQKQLLNDLQQKIVSQGTLYDAQISEERSQKSELQGLLESEKVRVLEMQETLERERELHAQLQAHDDHEQDKMSTSGEEVLRELQKQLYEKHNRIVELVSAIEKYKLDSLQMRQQVEKDRQIHRKTLITEQQANTEGLKKIHELQSKMEDLHWQLEEKRQQIYKLELERKRSQEIIQELQKQEREKEEKIETGRVSYQNLNEPTTWDSSSDRTRNWVLQQKMEGTEKKESSYPPLIEMNGDGTTEDELETIRQKLQLISSKLQQLAHKASSRLQFEAADDEDFIWVQKNIDHILLQLQKFAGLSQQGEPTLASPGISCSSLTERLLRQNAELTGLISHLTEEKNDLRNVVMKLEEEIRWFRQTGPCGDYSLRHSFNHGTNIEEVIASEKEIWNREKLVLQKSLRRAEAEVCKLKAELRNEALLQDLNPNSENATLKRIYGKYLRAESFRKALIYQKNYLLLLLGGFQECEDATLALIARMGGQPSCTDLTVITNQSKGFTRFRSAVRVSIAISRMKFLVRRWHRVTGSCSININRDGFGQSPGTFWATLGTEKSDPFYPSPGGLELCGEQRHSSYRSRSDLDCPRSPLHFQHRYQGPTADLNPGSFACSQLQNYDPDRALTDYISRLEALQRRLGNVQSGSTTSYTQFHTGMRR